jgi:hypothetical protein
MISRKSLILAGLVPLALAGCMQADAASRSAERNRGPSGPPVHVTGAPVSCIRVGQVTESKVRDNRTIDFMRNSRQGWRNTLPYECSGLRLQDAFTYRISGNELCSVDFINVLETAGGLSRGAACGLGQFVPIELDKRR